MSDSQEPAVRLPTINVGWSEATKEVAIQFDKDTFPTWDFIAMVLGAAHELAKFNLNMARAEAFRQQQMARATAMLQAQQQAAVNAQKINRKILEG